MALSAKALQKKRAKKKSKRQIKAPHSFSSSTINYSHWPVGDCWVPNGLWAAGIGHVIVTRANDQGSIAIGLYLIDTFCLGVKDCFVRLGNEGDYQSLLENTQGICGELECVTPSYASTLIQKAVEYADKAGFKPHSDYLKAKKLLNGIPIDENQKFDFGRDGKPLYIQGPHETQADVRRIMKTLEQNNGAENYDFMIEVPETRELLVEEEV